MTLQTVAIKNALASAYAAQALYGALYTTVPGATAGTEVTGGTPAYARKSLAWGAPANGVITASAVFDVPTGTTLVGSGCHSAATAGTYLDGGTLTSQAFASQGTYTETFTFTAS